MGIVMPLRTISGCQAILQGISHLIVFAFLVCPCGRLNAQTINVSEYFFDTDPGAGNGIPMAIAAPAEPVTFSSTISVSGLPPGRHYLYARTRTSDGHWSLHEPREFFIQSPVANGEYFFDTDPGAGNGIPMAITVPVDPLTFSSTISIAGLTPGRHYLYTRIKDESGAWSLHEPREFFIQTPIALAEYFFDTDPGVGLAAPIPITTTIDDFTFTSSLPVGGLPDGDHYLYVRVKDESGAWSLHQPTLFTVSSVVPVELTVFSAKRNGLAVDLSWTTASETNNDYFAVERWIPDGSYTEESFSMIDKVKGNGTTSIAHHYRVSDQPQGDSKTIYYRLKQVDFDGTSTYSQVVAVLFDPLGAVIKLYPNPASTRFTLEVEAGGDGVAVEMLDISGQTIESHEKVSSLVFGENWTPGIYIVRIRKADEVLSVKVVKAQ